jgi:hypothetical protein
MSFIPWMISSTWRPGVGAWRATRAAYRPAAASSDPTTAASEGVFDPGAAWVTSAPKIM